MTARILVVDDVPANIRLLEAKLLAEYFDVITATNGLQALEKVEQERPDIILLDVMMPQMDGFEVCRRLKQDPGLMHIPVIMVTALSEPSDRVTGLQAGADDFLTKPVNDVALYARVRSLVRLKLMMDELRQREATSNNFGIVEATAPDIEIAGAGILLVEDREANARRLEAALAETHHVTVARDGDAAAALGRNGGFELIIVSLSLRGTDGLRLCSQFRSMDETRQVPVLMLVDDTPDEMARLVKGLELGVNDYLIRPIDQNELLARTRTQLRRKRYEDRLRANYQRSVTLAVTDALTGLFNRRYMEAHLGALVARGGPGERQISVLMMDIDHFKEINDAYGHGVGDEVLREFAGRITREIRGIDLAVRYGGEEFVVVMPETGLEEAATAAERLRQQVAGRPFSVSTAAGELSVTVSIGVAVSQRERDAADQLLHRADEALYAAKRAGRNRVEFHRSCASRKGLREVQPG